MRQVRFHFPEDSETREGYEIYVSITTSPVDTPAPLLDHLAGGEEDEYFADRTYTGIYVHGILDDPLVINYLLEPFADKLRETTFDRKALKEEQYDELVAHVRKYIDPPLIYQILTDSD